jgi:RNA polymerase sporulation-specific sigma factor
LIYDNTQNYDLNENIEEMVFNDSVSKKLDKLLVACLTKREYEIICLRYGLNGNPMLPQREVAKKLNISRSYISRLEKKALEIIRRNIKKEEFGY